MLKIKKAAAVLMAAVSVMGFAASPVQGFTAFAKQTDVSEQINNLQSSKKIVLYSSKGADESDIAACLQSIGNTGSTLKLVGNFTVKNTLTLRGNCIIDASEAVINSSAELLLNSYEDEITIKGGTWNLGSQTRLIKISNGRGGFCFDSMNINSGGSSEYGVFMIYGIGSDEKNSISPSVIMKNCHFKNTKSQAVFVYNSRNIYLVNNTFDNIDGHGIYAYNSENVNTLGNKMNGIRGDAVKYCKCKNGNISANNLQKITRHPDLDIDPLKSQSRSGCGMLISECEKINVGKAYSFEGRTYEGNTVQSCENYGMHINLSDYTYVYKSSFTDIGSDGIHNSASANTTLSNCSFSSCKEKGIFFIPGPVNSVAEKLRNCQGAGLYNNIVSNCESFGIMLSKSKSAKLENNTIKSCKDYGIYLNECDGVRLKDNITTDTKSVNGSGIGDNKSKNVVFDNNLKLDKSSVSLGRGESYTLSTTNNTVTWSTSNSKVAVVSGGKITAKSNGTVTITAKTSSGQTAVCKVTVKSEPTWVTISKKTLTLGVGETYKLSAAIPSNAAAAVRKFRTSDSSIIKMTKTNWEGEFKALKPGTAWVTVRLYNGKEASCKITVKWAPTWVSISQKTMTMKVGQTANLSASIASNAGCAKRTFRTSNSSIIKMTKTDWTGSFKAMKPGTAWVTVRTYNGKESSCKITVTKPA